MTMRTFIFCFLLLMYNHTCIAQKGSHWIPMLRAQVAIKKGKYQKAEYLVDKAYDRFSTKKEKRNLLYTEYTNNLGRAFLRLGKDSIALLMLKKPVEILESKKHSNQRILASYITNLAEAYRSIDDYNTSKKYCEKALGILLNKLNENHKDVATTYNNLGIVHHDLGNYEISKNYTEKALKIRIKKLGLEHVGVANLYNRLAVLHRALCDYESSKKYHEKALKIRKKKLVENHIDISTTYNNLSLVYRDLGDYETSRKYCKMALDILLENTHKEFIHMALSYNNMGLIYQDMGNYEVSKNYFEKALNIWLKELKGEHSDMALSYNNIGLLYRNMGYYEASKNHFKEALDIWLKEPDGKHIYIALCYNNLAVVHSDLRDYETSEKYLKQALNIQLKKQGEEYGHAIKSYNNLAEVYELMELYEKADSLWQISIPKTLKRLKTTYLFLPEKQRMVYLKTIRNPHNSFYSFAYNYGDDTTKELAIKLYLNTKSLSLDYGINTNKLIKEINDKKLTKSFDLLNILNNKLAKAEVMSDEKLKKIGWNISRKREERDSLTSQLLRHPELRKKLNTKTIEWQDIQDSLATNEATIDFLRIYEKKDSLWAYYGIVISKELSSPQFVRLAEDKALNEYLIDTLVGKPHYLSDDGKSFELYKKIWQPLEPYLEGITKIHLSPSGALHQVSFESLIYNSFKEQYLAERYQFHYYSALRDMLKEKTETPDYKDIVLGGDIIYDLNQEGERLKNEKEVLGIAAINRGSRNGFKYLPHTLNEIVGVRKIAEKSGLNATLLTGTAVTEDTVRHFSGKLAPSILHWATHGDFLTHSDSIDHSGIGSYHRLRVSDNPLQRSLLAFYGANYRWKQNERTLYSDDDDGILTALEVTALDLQNTNLVVLSACSTGLGHTDDTEGVFGLQRAFKLAGVDYVVASLWNVNDEATQQLMVQFYQNLLQQKQSPADALRNAKEGFMKNDVDPEFWAGFILIE